MVAAKKLLVGNSTAAKAGFGIHLDGKSEWDGRTKSFIQCVDNQSISGYVLKDHGLFADVADFYRLTAVTRNRKTLVSGLVTRFGSGFINQRIQAIRVS
jgi:hypothetical protein